MILYNIEIQVLGVFLPSILLNASSFSRSLVPKFELVFFFFNHFRAELQKLATLAVTHVSR